MTFASTGHKAGSLTSMFHTEPTYTGGLLTYNLNWFSEPASLSPAVGLIDR
jgi:hypothetical protein